MAKTTTSGPRFPRGLALVLGAGFLASLLVAGLRPFRRHENPVATAAPVMAELPPHAAGNEAPASDAVGSPSAREWFWKQTFARMDDDVDDDRREALWAEFAAQIPMSDVSAALAELQSLGYGESELCRRLLQRWAEADGNAAAGWAAQMPAGARRERALAEVATEWANTDLAAAAAWAGALPELAERHATMLAVANEAVRTEPIEALRLAAQLPASQPRDELVRHAAMEWALQDAATAADWAQQISDLSLRRELLAAIAISAAETAPGEAAALAIEMLPPGRLLDDTVISVVQRWAQQEPDAVRAWVTKFPAGPLRETGLAELAHYAGSASPR